MSGGAPMGGGARPFAPVPPDWSLAPGCVAVWRVELDASPNGAALLDVLDAEERARAERFRHERDRRRFVAAHAALRHVLERVTGRAARSLRFERDAHGRPSLAGHQLGPDFDLNLTHAGELALVATSRAGRVGVDLEAADRLGDLDQLARTVLAPSECLEFARLPADERHWWFLAAWTRKEAVLKALGTGLSLPPERVACDGDRARVEGVEPPARAWRLHALDAGPGYAAALALADPAPEPFCWHWT